MSKRFQIPASPRDHRLFQTAARRAGLSAAEWARRLLRREAESQLKGKSWDQFFADLDAAGNVDQWEAPARRVARPVGSKKDDWG